MFSDAPYWRPPSRALSMVFQTYGLEARFWPINKRDRFGSDKGVYRNQSGGIRISVTYHTRQAFSETMGCPALQPNASWKAAEFCTAPFTRQRPGE